MGWIGSHAEHVVAQHLCRSRGLCAQTVAGINGLEEVSRYGVRMTVGPVYWGSFPGDLLERVMAVLLFQERPRAWRRRPSQGDGGVDVVEPVDGGYHVFQVKGFTGRLTSSRRRQTQESLEQVRTDPRLDGPVVKWSLVLPTDLTSEEEAWFAEMTGETDFDSNWLGQTFWESEAAKYPYVVDYYLGNGKARLEQSIRDVRSILSEPGTELRAVDVTGRLSELHSAINRNDPHYRYEFSTSVEPPTLRDLPGLVLTWSRSLLGNGDWISIDIYAKYAQATEDAPVGGRFVLVAVDDARGIDLREDFRALHEYGRGLELPIGMIKDLEVEAPGGLSQSAETGGGRIGPAYVESFRPRRERAQVIGPTGELLAETKLEMEFLTRGAAGLEVHGRDAGSAFGLTIRMQNFDGDTRIGDIDFTVSVANHVGLSASRLLPGCQLLQSLCAPNVFLWRPEFGPDIQARAELPKGGLIELPAGYVAFIEALDTIQQHTSIQIVVPETMSKDDLAGLVMAARLLHGEVISGTWSEKTMKGPLDEIDKVAAQLRPAASVAVEYNLEVQLGSVAVDLGKFHVLYRHACVASVSKENEEGVIRLVPGADNGYEQRWGAMAS